MHLNMKLVALVSLLLFNAAASDATSCRTRCRGAIAACVAAATGEAACGTMSSHLRRDCARSLRKERRRCRTELPARCATSPEGSDVCTNSVPWVEPCDAIAGDPVEANPEWVLNLALDGPGFFLFQSGQGFVYRTAADVFISNTGMLTDLYGRPLVGQALDADGKIVAAPGPIFPPRVLPNRATSRITLRGNLEASAPLVAFDPMTPESAFSTAAFITSVRVYGGLGQAFDLFVFFTRTAPNVWDATAAVVTPDDPPQLAIYGSATLAFGVDGLLTNDAAVPLGGVPPGDAPFRATLSLDMTQFAATAGISRVEQDGDTSRAATSLTVDARGILWAATPTSARPLYQLNLATFAGPALLKRCRHDFFRATIGSGPATVGVAQTPLFGSVLSTGQLL